MDRCAVLVDAGYLLSGAYTLLTGARSDRSRLRPGYPALTEAIRARAEGETGLPVLRIYWYDAAFQRQPTAEHRTLRALRDVKVRLGNLVVRDEGPPQQKGVDAELHADLVTLARNRAVADVVLVTGDEDLCVPVERAQEYGVRVHLWAVPTSTSSTNQSPELVATADRRTVLEFDWIADHFAVARDPFAAVSVLPRSGRTAGGTGTGWRGPGDRTEPGGPTVPVEEAPAGTDTGTAGEAVTAPPTDPGAGTGADTAAGSTTAHGDPDPAGGGTNDEVGPSPATMATATSGATAGTGLPAPRHAADPFEVGREYGIRWCRRAVPEECDEIARDRPRIAAAIDRDLLRGAERRGVDTWSDEEAKHAVRDGFWRGVDFVRDLDEIGTERDTGDREDGGNGADGEG